jgi:hypothetical protein
LELTKQGRKSQEIKTANTVFKKMMFVAKKNCYFVAFQTLLVVHALITIANEKFFNV